MASGDAAAKVPGWLRANVFEDLLHEHVVGFKEVTSFQAYPAMTAGENFATVMLRVEMTVRLKDDSSEPISYMLKTPLSSVLFQKIMAEHNIFHIEQGMYTEMVPEMEQMFREAGAEVRFGAKYYELRGDEYPLCILLEDLRPRGFKNANRLEGLDLAHAKCVLKKLAQWHAASATRAKTRGPYPDSYRKGFFVETNKDLLKEMFENFAEPMAECLKMCKGSELYTDDLLNMQAGMAEGMRNYTEPDDTEFNVLNHGDCWVNNIMFQYDGRGQIEETYFVDYQIPKYGTPAQDLLYFILSSVRLDLKMKHFDRLIKYYHDRLVECLQLLNYPGRVPKLRELHMMLFKYGFWGYFCATGILAIVLLDPTESANLDNFISRDDEGKNFKRLLYTNPRYIKQMELLLPWLYHRGAFERL